MKGTETESEDDMNCENTNVNEGMIVTVLVAIQATLHSMFHSLHGLR